MFTIIACCGSKRDYACQAEDMYLGQYYRYCLAYAKLTTDISCILILSAKHGLIKLNEVIEPYDLMICDPQAVDDEKVRDQAERLGLLDKDVVVIGGKYYVRICQEVWPNCKTPFHRKGVNYGCKAQMGDMKRLGAKYTPAKKEI